MNIRAPKGTTDLIGDDVKLWQFMESAIRRVCRRYNIDEIRTPIFESTALFVRSIGEVTDIVEKEMYTFDSKGGESLTLRPEGTASIVRAILENSVYKQNPLMKQYYMGPMFRYERPQAGRSRQFHQFGVELIGSYVADMDAEVISLAYDIYREMGIDDVSIRLNSIGSQACRDRYREALQAVIEPNLSKYCKSCNDRYGRNIFRVLDCKNPECGELNKSLPSIEASLSEDSHAHFEKVKSALTIRDIPFTVDPTIVRGFDYYTNTVFELKHGALGAQDAIGGGGRYDNLVEELGGPKMGAVGFALGLERTIMALKARDIQAVDKGVDVYVLAMGEGAHEVGLKLIQTMRLDGKSVECNFEGKSFKAQMKLANKLGAKKVMIIGDDELAKGVVAVKNMENSEQTEVKLEDLLGNTGVSK